MLFIASAAAFPCRLTKNRSISLNPIDFDNILNSFSDSDQTRNGAGETGFAGSCAMLVEWLCPLALQCLLHITIFPHRPSAGRLLPNEDSVAVGLQGTKWRISFFCHTFAGASHSPASPAWTAFPIRGSWMPLFISRREINNRTIKGFSKHRRKLAYCYDGLRLLQFRFQLGLQASAKACCRKKLTGRHSCRCGRSQFCQDYVQIEFRWTVVIFHCGYPPVIKTKFRQFACDCCRMLAFLLWQLLQGFCCLRIYCSKYCCHIYGSNYKNIPIIFM